MIDLTNDEWGTIHRALKEAADARADIDDERNYTPEDLKAIREEVKDYWKLAEKVATAPAPGNAEINQMLLAACTARLACDDNHDQGTKEWHDAVLRADEQMRVAIGDALVNKERDDALKAEMLQSLKDVAELMKDDTGEWIDSVKALIAKAESANIGQPEKWLLVVWDDVEPALFGPFATDEERDTEAKKMRKEHGDEHGIYTLEYGGAQLPMVGAYSGTFFDDIEEEEEVSHG